MTPNTNAKDPKEIRKEDMEIFKHFATKVLIVVIIVLVIVIGSYGILKLVPQFVSSLAAVEVSVSSIFKPAEKLSLSIKPSTVTSGEPFTLLWTHANKSDVKGSYNISYSCTDGVTLFMQQGGYPLPCGENTSVDKATSAALTAFSGKNPSVEVPISVSFIGENSATPIVEDSGTLLLTNPNLLPAQTPVQAAATSTVTSAPAVTTATSQVTVSKPQAPGKPDLSVEVLATGILDKVTGQFSAVTSIGPNDRPAVKFVVKNIGTANSGPWDFSVLLPVAVQKNVYNSTEEQSLAPGDSIEFTLGFDGLVYSSQNTLTISVDDGQKISELHRDNNVATVTFNETGANYYAPQTTTTYYTQPSNYTTQTYQYPSYQINSYGSEPDLSIRIISMGVLDSYTNTITPAAYITPGQTVGVKFEVTNIGAAVSPQWTFSAAMPGYAANTYTSPLQAPLSTGQSVDLTVGFGNSMNYQQSEIATVTINIDPNNSILEQRKDNNTVSGTMQINPPANYYYPTQNYYPNNYSIPVTY